jgi:hypothetical protein
VAAPEPPGASIRATLAAQGVEVDEDELPLVQLLHDLLAPTYASLLTADPGRFPHEPVDPSRAPDDR